MLFSTLHIVKLVLKFESFNELYLYELLVSTEYFLVMLNDYFGLFYPIMPAIEVNCLA